MRKLKNKQEDRQIATWVCDVNYKRYRRYCPKCKVAEYLNTDDVDGALGYINELTGKFRSNHKLYNLKKLSAYIERNREGIWYKEAREKGISIGSGFADKAGDILICRCMKLLGMRWSRDKADNVLNIRILVLNGEWDEFWKKHKAA